LADNRYDTSNIENTSKNNPPIINAGAIFTKEVVLKDNLEFLKVTEEECTNTTGIDNNFIDRDILLYQRVLNGHVGDSRPEQVQYLQQVF
jgi:glutaminase